MKLRIVYHPNGEYYTWLVMIGDDIHHYGDGETYALEESANRAGNKWIRENPL